MIGRSRTDAVDESPDGHDADSAPSELSLDDIYHLLQTKRRRDVLRYLRDAEGRVQLRELAEQVAAWEQETTVDDLSSSERQRVYISLYQSHLPKLDTHGIVDYDKDRGWVEATPLTDRLDSYLEAPGEPEPVDPWPQRYAVSVALCTLFLGANAANIVTVPRLVDTGIVLAVFALVTGTHLWSTGSYRR